MEDHVTEAMAPSKRQEQAMWSPPNTAKTALMELQCDRGTNFQSDVFQSVFKDPNI